MLKNITIASSYFAPAWSYGGPPKVLYTLAKELVKKGKKIKVITTDALDDKRNPILREELDGISIFRFKTISNYLAYKRNFFFLPCVSKLVGDILQHSDFVIFSDLRSIFNWQLYPLVVNKNIPYGIFAFGEIPRGLGFKAVVKKTFDILWVDDFVKKAKYLFSQTNHESRMYSQFFNVSDSKICFLPLPVETIQKSPSKEKLSRFRKQFNLSAKDKIILFVGRLHYLKGIDTLMEAIFPLIKKNCHLKLMIVGRDDGVEDILKKLITKETKKQIIFTGPLYGKNVACAYYLASCFVITPRFYEETSLAALEALSYGVPVIVSRQADIPYLEEYNAGYIVHNDSDSIEKAVMQVLEKVKTDKTLMKKNAQKLISEKFSPPVIVKKLLSIVNANYELPKLSLRARWDGRATKSPFVP